MPPLPKYGAPCPKGEAGAPFNCFSDNKLSCPGGGGGAGDRLDTASRKDAGARRDEPGFLSPRPRVLRGAQVLARPSSAGRRIPNAAVASVPHGSPAAVQPVRRRGEVPAGVRDGRSRPAVTPGRGPGASRNAAEASSPRPPSASSRLRQPSCPPAGTRPAAPDHPIASVTIPDPHGAAGTRRATFPPAHRLHAEPKGKQTRSRDARHPAPSRRGWPLPRRSPRRRIPTDAGVHPPRTRCASRWLGVMLFADLAG